MLSRRSVLLGGAAGAALLTGCTISDPRMRGYATVPPAQPSPTPTPALPGLDDALVAESELQQLCGQLAARSFSPALTASATAAAEAHRAHLTALLAPDPTARSATPPTPARGRTPRPTPQASAQLPPGDRAAALRAVTDRLARAAEAYRASARAASGSTALLWASLAAYATGQAAALPLDVPRAAPTPAPARPLEPWSDAEAAQQMVRQLHAMIYGYQAAYPAFRRPESSEVFDLITRRRDLRDRLSAWLRDRGQSVPAAEPAYALPTPPTDRARAGELLASLETAFQPFAGAWVAAATDADQRGAAVGTLEDATRLALRFGAPVSAWPGWPA